MTLWDDYHKDGKGLREWLYGPQSLDGATRAWFVDMARQWPRGTTLLDAGCGGGVTAYQLANAGVLDRLQYVGVDFSQVMLDLAHEMVPHPNASFVLGELVAGKVPVKGPFDKVLLRAVLEHNEDPAPVIGALHGLVADDLFVVFWNNPVDGLPVRAVVDGGFCDIAHSEKELRGLFRCVGFEVVEVLPFVEKSARSDTRVVWRLKPSARKKLAGL